MVSVVGIIPARLASTRFPRKVLYPFAGVPMVEHVRRRASLMAGLDDVYVATCDDEIADLVRANGGKVIMTTDTHVNGTTRAAEAIAGIDCTHVMLLQGDAPLLLPRHVDKMIAAIALAPSDDAWNATAPTLAGDELDRASFVKCAVGSDDRVLYAFRRSPSVAAFAEQQSYIRKMLGLIAYRRDFLIQLAERPRSSIEQYESIEQLRIIEMGGKFTSVPVDESLPSVNEPHETEIVEQYIRENAEQQRLLEQILAGGKGRT